MAFGELVWDSLLSSVFQVLFDKLLSSALSFVQSDGIDDRLNNWKTKLHVLYKMLNDAEAKQIAGDQAVKSWLDDVRDLAYDLEDLLDEFAIEAAKQEQEAESSTTGGLRKRKRLSFSSIVSDRNMRSKMQDIESRLQDILRTKDLLNLEGSAAGISTVNQDAKRLSSSSLEEPCFVGRKKEENEIIQLLKTDVNHTIPTVIPIVGMGGIGKTTLAQQVYNDAQVTSHFEIKAWACVSDVFDVHSITRSILQSISSIPCEVTGAHPYPLKELQQDDCMVLFAHHAFGVNRFEDHPHLEEIGKKIVDKCKGLPLAAKTLGGLLRTKVERSQWEAILNSKLWDLPKERNEILPALKLSYLHLPSHLKRCFTYCAIFPKDYGIERDMLIYWWMAEGLLGENDGNNRWGTGLDYFSELVSRSFFQQAEESRYLMHDLIHDLAMSISGATCFSAQELELEAYENNACLVRTRHASFVPKSYVTLKMLRRYHGMKKLRSFVALRGPYIHSLPQKALHDLVSELKDVRVFSMSYCCIKKVPDSIGELKRLHHLDFSYTIIQMLPKSIGSIYSLEALLLRGCGRLMELPQEIAMLNNLQYLDIRDTPSLRAIPSNSGNVKMPTWFVGGILKGPRLKELKHFMRLEGKLFISELQQVEQVRDTRDVRLCEKQGISELELKWAEEFDDSRNKVLENSILESFQPHINLKILKISYYGGTRFPPWLGSTLYTSIVHVALCGCHHVALLPSLGQLPSLKELHIDSLNLVTKIGNEFYGTKKPFPSLRTLEFNRMSTWENWFNCGGACKIEAPFICLEHLIIRDCPKLIGRLPRELDSLTTLEIDSCLCLEESSHVISLPSLKELYLRNCNLRILNSLVSLTSLNILGISTIPDLIFFERGLTKSLTKLERLMIERCEKLMYLWRDGDEVQYHASLKSLSVKKCPRLASLMAMPPNLQDLQIVDCDSLHPSEFESGRFPVSLKLLEIKCYNEMNFVPKGDWNYEIRSRRWNNLRSLELDGFSYLKELSVTHIFGMEYQWIEKISIKECNNLRSLQLGGFSHLKELFIMDCNTLEVVCFPPIPITTSRITLWNCANIKYLPNNLNQLTSLEALYIYNCENIRCFPEGHLPLNLKYLEVHGCRAFRVECFPPLPIAISRFSLQRCPNIKYLPNNLHQLTSLETLYIEECQNIRCLPKGGLPLNLQHFECEECRNMKTPIREWGLHRLTSLDVLKISGSIAGVGEKPCFTASADDDDEDDAWDFLPPSLTTLFILDVTEGERLSSGLCSHLPSLRQLCIINCLKLRYFPKDGLPSSLEQLHITSCARLEERFSKPNGDYCHLIHEIPFVIIQ